MSDGRPDRHRTPRSIFVRLRGDDAQAVEMTWREFHDRYAPLIAAVCRRLGVRDDEADDVVQEVMLGFFRASPEFEYDPAKGRFRGYLKAATARAIRRLCSAHPRHDGADRSEPQSAAAIDNAWNSEWGRSVLTRSMRSAADRVEPRTFEAFELTAIRGVPTDAASERLGMTEAGVRQARSRVSRLIREEIDRITETEG